MKKSLLCLLLSLLLLLGGCGEVREEKNANQIRSIVEEHKELLLACVKEMEAFEEERVYVAMEYPEKDEEAEEAETEEAMETKEKRLVFFTKESEDRTVIENEVLQKALETLGLEIIFYQTASDSRRTVIFSSHRESYKEKHQGFYYSYDDAPSGWWGRVAKLEKKDNRYLQANESADALYYTLRICENFYYYEKEGSLLA